MEKIEKRVSGFLREKDGRYHTVITYYDDGKRCIKTKSTGILIFNKKGKKVESNRKKAESILWKLKEEYEKKLKAEYYLQISFLRF